MRKISATLVCPVSAPAIKRGVVVVDHDGTILDIRGPLEKEEANVEYYNGILIPGLVNAHCHLELSHLKGTIEPSLGMAGFIEAITKQRHVDESIIEKAILQADRFMYEDGINLVGDVSNGNATFSAKAKSKITYHTFVEAFSADSSTASKIIQEKQSILNEAREKYKLSASLTLHAPYSISPELVSAFNSGITTNELMSFHLFESQEEIDYMEHGTGPLAELYQRTSRKEHPLEQWGENAYHNIFAALHEHLQMLAVHSCKITKPLIEELQTHFQKTWFVLAPRSNKYIHNEQPPIEILLRNGANITLGTDSLASNYSLSILEEMKWIAANMSYITLEQLLMWATLNGAKALNQDSTFGSLEKNKKPGVLLLTGIDMLDLKLSEKTRVRRLV